ncbi:nucleolar zinc-finger protein [Friedmanniomyces endolithicus]|uniref:Nucleolar zinc-finger protein n=1 Tax=Friedmanniomyces endolithicus TaxID=329885 RepID=A0AAN6QYW6_9PEZI|nr:nucleolar zinc-finger protein [Friedmanniomyces endolithicus]KAK0800419.1 nucleolar zinc-finger protein [Friedmanniomyces endolithicus]KAK0807246.1 nucleolar zinc-finger protein [Friedmanniomyces endolithicus]KAK0811615.1 nucleolar zinc-finger protein [Friedmanniomyces endolithicus]KAK0845054.1 nucleolar zinc-finger protein [Friedmanniomyces endolithicus]
MAQQANGTGERLQGASLAQDLFEDMGRKADSLGLSSQNGHAEGETEQKVVEEIESLCMSCHENGITRLLLTRIPFFREIVIMSFDCTHCGFRNNEIQSAGEIQPKGARYALRVEKDADLQRQVVKSDICVFRIEDLDLEIPAGKGQYTNVEGVLSGVRTDLESNQEARMEQMPEVGEKIAGILRTLADMMAGRKYPFMVSADDPSGNSWIEWTPGDAAGKWAKSEYNRTAAQNGMLGLGDDVPAPEHEHHATAPDTEIRPEYHAAGMVHSLSTSDSAPATNNVDDSDIVEDQVYSFPASCPGCTRPCATNMKMVNIPYFKQVVLMSTVCESCGYRSNEVKTGGEVPEKGCKITLQVRTKEDLSRDILKSESAAHPHPDPERSPRSGIWLEDGDAAVPDGSGDSMPTESKRTWEEFFSSLGDAIEGRKPFSLTLEDPLASSYVQSLTAPEPDPQIEIEEYERTEEELEDLGLNDMKTEGYEA